MTLAHFETKYSTYFSNYTLIRTLVTLNRTISECLTIQIQIRLVRIWVQLFAKFISRPQRSLLHVARKNKVLLMETILFADDLGLCLCGFKPSSPLVFDFGFDEKLCQVQPSDGTIIGDYHSKAVYRTFGK